MAHLYLIILILYQKGFSTISSKVSVYNGVWYHGSFHWRSWHTFNVAKGETLCVVRVILSHNYDSSLGPMFSLALQRSKYNVRLISTEFEVMGPRSFLFSLTRSTFRIFPLLCQMKVPVLYELISLYRCTCDNFKFFYVTAPNVDLKITKWVS